MSVFPGVWALLGVGVCALGCVGKTTGEGLLPSHYIKVLGWGYRPERKHGSHVF